jgi:hypothetical protein
MITRLPKIRRLLPVAMALLLILPLLSGCHKDKTKTASPKGKKSTAASKPKFSQYQLMQAELVLANTVKPYLVLDLAKGALEIRLKGVIVWDYPLAMDPDESAPLDKFARMFLNDEGRPVRPVAGKYLFASQGRSPDTLLAIVSGVLNVDPGLLQRDIPSRFQIQWAKNIILDVSTDVSAEPTSKFKNTLLQVSQALQRPFGEARLTMKMHPDAALTFWRAIDIGLPTLIIPPP